mmetsp:Transcript_121606/g.349523  ORF Transcript_121606/g.349523 Transcript_121606/m.349523 type:complete len:232 (-) Transcript_121606:1427-2122(-)
MASPPARRAQRAAAAATGPLPTLRVPRQRHRPVPRPCLHWRRRRHDRMDEGVVHGEAEGAQGRRGQRTCGAPSPYRRNFCHTPRGRRSNEGCRRRQQAGLGWAANQHGRRRRRHPNNRALGSRERRRDRLCGVLPAGSAEQRLGPGPDGAEEPRQGAVRDAVSSGGAGTGVNGARRRRRREQRSRRCGAGGTVAGLRPGRRRLLRGGLGLDLLDGQWRYRASAPPQKAAAT